MSSIIESRYGSTEPDLVELDHATAVALVEFVKYVRVTADPRHTGITAATTRLTTILESAIAMSESMLPNLEALITDDKADTDQQRAQLADLARLSLNSAVLRISGARQAAA